MKQAVIQKAEEKPKQQGPNLTGIPTQMKLDFEQRSGLSFDDVRVHYNSDKPARIGALAYTQGTQVHVGPGQERHLRHELGHVVQQKRYSIPSTRSFSGISINDDSKLEYLADNFGRDSSTFAPRLSFSGSPIQMKAEASVSLRRKSEDNILVNSEDYYIDTIKILGRSDTGLKNEDGKKTQGDHIIADTLIKKFQKSAVKGMTIQNVLKFYYNMLAELASDAHRCSRLVNDVKSDQSKNIDANTIQKISARNEKALNSVYHTMACLDDSPKTIINWRKQISMIIAQYNDAYSLSFFATFGVGTGGKGEGNAKAVLPSLFHLDTEINLFQYENAYNFLDTISLERASSMLPESNESIAYVTDRFINMLNFITSRNQYALNVSEFNTNDEAIFSKFFSHTSGTLPTHQLNAIHCSEIVRKLKKHIELLKEAGINIQNPSAVIEFLNSRQYSPWIKRASSSGDCLTPVEIAIVTNTWNADMMFDTYIGRLEQVFVTPFLIPRAKSEELNAHDDLKVADPDKLIQFHNNVYEYQVRHFILAGLPERFDELLTLTNKFNLASSTIIALKEEKSIQKMLYKLINYLPKKEILGVDFPTVEKCLIAIMTALSLKDKNAFDDGLASLKIYWDKIKKEIYPSVDDLLKMNNIDIPKNGNIKKILYYVLGHVINQKNDNCTVPIPGEVKLGGVKSATIDGYIEEVTKILHDLSYNTEIMINDTGNKSIHVFT